MSTTENRTNKQGLQNAVFHAVYRSPQQRRRRLLAGIVLYLRHFSHGLILTWPFFLILGAGLWFGEGLPGWLLPTILVPGLSAWLLIYAFGARKDYRRLVRDRILEKGFLKKLR